MLHNRAGGPEQAARDLRNGPLGDELPTLRSTFLEVQARYTKTGDAGPSGYANQALQVEPEAHERELRADATDAVHRFFESLGL